MRAGDLLVHHPYDSFATSVERFVQQAVADPDVLAIKMTVYRTSDDSALVPSLIEAAERGKQAVCLVELKARFDERRNIGWARALEEAGAHVVHGLPGLKTHAKALLVVRREGAGVRHYVHIGTGNYHAKTARLYEDFGLFTTDREIAADVAELFNALTGAARSPTLPQGDRRARPHARLVPRPDRAHDRGARGGRAGAHRDEAELARGRALHPRPLRGVAGGRAGGPERARHLLPARRACRACRENIRVVSVVGRFLEHSRVYGFRRGDERRYWMGSADLMPRNLDTRVELLAPIEDPALRDEIEDTLERCLADDTFAWELRPDEHLGAPPRRHALGAPRADGAGAASARPSTALGRRERARPSRRLSASTRAAERRTRSRKARRARGPARSSRGKTSFQLALPVIRIRSAPARSERSAAARDARAVEHGLRPRGCR